MQTNGKLEAHHERQVSLLNRYIKTGYTPRNLKYQIDTRLALDHDDFIRIHQIQKEAEIKVLQVLIGHHTRASQVCAYLNQPSSSDHTSTVQALGLVDQDPYLPASPETTPRSHHTYNTDPYPEVYNAGDPSNHPELTNADTRQETDAPTTRKLNPLSIFKTYRHTPGHKLSEDELTALLLPEHTHTTTTYKRKYPPSPPLFSSHKRSKFSFRNTHTPYDNIDHQNIQALSPNIEPSPPALNVPPTTNFKEHESHTITTSAREVTHPPPPTIPTGTPEGTDDIITNIRLSVSNKGKTLLRKYEPGSSAHTSIQASPSTSPQSATLSPPTQRRTIYRHLRPRSQMSPHSPASTRYPHQLTPSQRERVQRNFAELWDQNDSWDEAYSYDTPNFPREVTTSAVSGVPTYPAYTAPTTPVPIAVNVIESEIPASKNFQVEENSFKT